MMRSVAVIQILLGIAMLAMVPVVAPGGSVFFFLFTGMLALIAGGCVLREDRSLRRAGL